MQQESAAAAASGVEVPAAVASKRRGRERIVIAYDPDAPPQCPALTALERVEERLAGSAPLGDATIDLALREKAGAAVIHIDAPAPQHAECIHRLWDELRVPSLVVTTCEDEAGLDLLVDAGAHGVLPADAPKSTAQATLNMFLFAAERQREQAQRIEQLERNLANRRIVEQAKWRLVQERGMTEPEAHSRLQSVARNTRSPLAEIARAVVDNQPLPGDASL